MRQILTELLNHVQGMWRYRWQALLIAWVVCLIGWFWVLTLPNIYQASAKIYVDTESMIKRLVRGIAIEPNVEAEFIAMTQALLSRPQLEKVAQETGMATRAESPEHMEKLIDNLQFGIELDQLYGQNIFSLRFQDRDRLTAAAVITRLLDVFVEDALGGKRADAGEAQAFLEQQIADYEQRLREAEQRLADFKRENVGLMPGDAGDYYARLQRATGAVASTQTEYRMAQERRDELKKQLAGEEPTFGIMPSTGMQQTPTSVDRDLAAYRAQLSELRARFTDQHPTIVSLLELIKELEEKRAEELALRGSIPGASSAQVNPLDMNPVYQEIKLALSQAEVEVATLRNKLRAEQSSLDKLKGLINTIPEVEAQLKQLDRDYNVTKDQYNVLLERRESLRMQDQVDKSGEDVRFRIIEPPFAPSEPVGPNRPLFLAIVFIAAFGVGGGVAFLLHQMNPVFFNGRQLRQILGLPVLGQVSMVASAEYKKLKRNRAALFVTATGCLVVLLLAVVLFHAEGSSAVNSVLTARR